MMKVDTSGFSALAVEAREGYVLVGLSDCTVAIIDLTREVCVCIQSDLCVCIQSDLTRQV